MSFTFPVNVSTLPDGLHVLEDCQQGWGDEGRAKAEEEVGEVATQGSAF